MARHRRYRAILWLLVLTAASLAQEPEHAAVFAGTVHDAITGQPLAHAAVRLIATSEGNGYQAITDSSGAFRFNALPAVPYRFETERVGYEESRVAVWKEWRFHCGREYRSSARGHIAGRVTDADGAPLAGARVNAIGAIWKRGQREYEISNSAVGDAIGNYRLHLSSGCYRIEAAGPRSNDPVPGIFIAETGAQKMKLATIYYPAEQTLKQARHSRFIPASS
jgi:protocatechuate 3,4-dioxygenase beta subunit